MIYLHTKFHIPGTNGSLSITIKHKRSIQTSHSSHVVVSHSTEDYFNNSCTLFEDLLSYFIYFRTLY